MEQEKDTKSSPDSRPVGEADDNTPEDGKKGRKKKKNKVVVINVPKKRKALKTPTQIIRFFLVIMFFAEIFFLTYPFLSAKLSINEDLEVVPDVAGTYTELATQEQIDQANAKLKAAYEGLEKLPEEESSKEEAASEETPSESTASKEESDSEPTYDPDNEIAPIRAINTANYEWTYAAADDVDIQPLAETIQLVRGIERDQYTEESLETLNNALLEAQRFLCATVAVSQNGLQMMLGGSISEAFGNYTSVGESILHGVLAFLLAIIPLVCFFAATFDRKRHIKHVIIIVGSLLCLVDIFLTIYPYVGIGAVLSIIMYIFILLLSIGSIYATQQERYIVQHPEKEPEFTEKHPHFVKALLNEKAFGSMKMPTAAEKDFQSAKNAQKQKTKKKKKK